GVRAAAVAEMDRADGVPGVRRTLTRVQLTIGFELELARELLERALLVPTRRQYEPMKQVQAHGLESSALRTLGILRRAAAAQLFQRRIKCLTSDEYGCRKPVREREAGAQCQDAMRRAKPLFAPADKRQPQMVTPVARVEGDGLSCCGDRLASAAASVQHER